MPPSGQGGDRCSQGGITARVGGKLPVGWQREEADIAAGRTSLSVPLQVVDEGVWELAVGLLGLRSGPAMPDT